ncbi:MAG TPA: aromatic amino acid transport family protein [Patescibacteria group bacterium]|nr:aromatic amino acid transport family protein [Patescibacteria group bacterium]
MKDSKVFFEAVAVLVGTIIGAGVLGIPYVVYQSGFIGGAILMALISVAVLIMNLYLGEIVLSTRTDHQLTGYAEKYLGKTGKYFMFGSVVFGFYGALLAYLIGEGQALAALTGGSPLVYSLIFFAFAALLVFIGLTVIKKAEFLLTLTILFIVIVIFFWGLGYLDFNNLGEFNLAKILIPYGVIFFSVSGASAIPELRRVLKGKERLVKKSIVVGTAIPFVVYVIFTFIVVGVAGFRVTEVATVGLGEVMGRSMIIFGNLFAFFTMATSFLTLGLALKNTYHFDFKLKHGLSWFLTVSLPLVIFLAGLNDFVKVMGTVGAIGGGLEGILIGLIYLKVKSQRERRPEYELPKSPWLVFLLSLIFVGGIIYAIWTF